jgi:hypothetical protein
MPILTQKAGKQIAVTEIKQFTLPAGVHIDDLRPLVYYADVYYRFQIDFADFTASRNSPDQEHEASVKEELVYELVAWLQKYGVSVEGGTYFKTDLSPWVR